MVKEIHRKARTAQDEGFSVIVIGDKKHDEVKGIIGQLKLPALVIDSPRAIPYGKLRRLRKAAVVVQSTQNIQTVKNIVRLLRTTIPNLVFYNTICRPTRLKQQEIATMPLSNDVMIVIGSRTSANTKRLYEISRSLNPRSYWIESKKELRSSWFRNAKRVGITAGASTPDETTQAVIASIQKIAS
jgi:4-hydroxy-3-methylbut-2-enyl diphosphate reductase